MAFTTEEFQFSTAVVEPPTGSQVRLNNVDQTAATLIWMRYTTVPGADLSHLLAIGITPGDTILLQDFDDATKYQRYEVVAPIVDKTTYAQIPVQWQTGGGPLLGQKLLVAFASPELPLGGDPGEVLTVNQSGDPEWLTPTAPAPVPPPVAAGYDGCPWPIDSSCLPVDWDSLDSDIAARSVALASVTLNRLTGYRVGGCPVTVRPCKKGCAGSWPSYYDRYGSSGSLAAFWPSNWGGVWVNSCGCAGDCSCTMLCEVALPAPVGEVYSVKVDGAAVTDWRVDGNRVVWTGTTACPWPTCQDMAKADTEPDTFSITYLNSYPVDGMGAYAAGLLAAEFAKACTTGKCRLPAMVTTVSRQGVTYEVAAGTFPDGTTGIREIDAYIGIWNPDHLRQQTRVWSPDLHTPRVVR